MMDEIEQEIKNIQHYVCIHTGNSTTEWRYYLEEALKYYNALFDWQSCFYFGREEHMGTAELLQECII